MILSRLSSIWNSYLLSCRDPLPINRKAKATCCTAKKNNHLIPLKKKNGRSGKKSRSDAQVKILYSDTVPLWCGPKLNDRKWSLLAIASAANPKLSCPVPSMHLNEKQKQLLISCPDFSTILQLKRDSGLTFGCCLFWLNIFELQSKEVQRSPKKQNDIMEGFYRNITVWWKVIKPTHH